MHKSTAKCIQLLYITEQCVSLCFMHSYKTPNLKMTPFIVIFIKTVTLVLRKIRIPFFSFNKMNILNPMKNYPCRIWKNHPYSLMYSSQINNPSAFLACKYYCNIPFLPHSSNQPYKNLIVIPRINHNTNTPADD